MRAYIIRRLLLALVTVLIVTFMVFFLIRIIPGDVVDALAGTLSVFGIELEDAREMIIKELGLDVPVLQQYGRWMGVVPQMDGSFSGLIQGDLGESVWQATTVLDEIGRRWSVTFELGLLALIVAQLIALPIGIYSALRQDTWGDYIGRSFAILLIAVPPFWIAILAIVFPAIWWGYMSPIMLIRFTEDPIGNLSMFIVPAIVLGMALSGATMRMTRTMMLEVLRQDYIRTAWAKGLKERVVILRHALKNALIPVVTVVGLQMPIMLGGAVIIEYVFCLPGMGSLLVNSTALRDYPIVSGVILVFALGMVVINLIVDLCYAYLDPRVLYK